MNLSDHVEHVDYETSEAMRRYMRERAATDADVGWVNTRTDAQLLDEFDQHYPGGAAQFIQDYHSA